MFKEWNDFGYPFLYNAHTGATGVLSKVTILQPLYASWLVLLIVSALILILATATRDIAELHCTSEVRVCVPVCVNTCACMHVYACVCILTVWQDPTHR